MWIRSFQYYIENNLDPRNQNAQKVSIIHFKSRAKILKIKNLPKRRQIGEHVNEKVIKIEHDIKRF